MKKIICISPNTNVESTWTLPGLVLGGVFRSEKVIHIASGKGINVCRACRLLGNPALPVGFVAGNLGRWFVKLAKEEDLWGLWIRIGGEGRQALALYDPLSKGDATLLSGPGPQVTKEDWDKLETAVLRRASSASYVCISGSLPPGSPLESYAGLIEKLRDGGKRVWVDADGRVLQAALGAQPAGVKINAREASEWAGIPIHELGTAFPAIRRILDRGVSQVVITLGRYGAVFGSGDGGWFVSAPEIPGFIHSVGSGDAFMAGLLVGLSQGKKIPHCLQMAAAAGGANAMTFGGGRFALEDYQTLLPTIKVTSLSE